MTYEPRRFAPLKARYPFSVDQDPVVAFIDYYLNPRIEIDYAVMVDGMWGCGKTFFIKSYFEYREKVRKHSDPLTAKDYLYVSLYGVSNVEEIRERVWAEAHPRLSSQQAQLLGAAASGVAKKISGIELRFDDLRKFYNALKSFVVIFDDLERATVDIRASLGFINALVEHSGTRVIIVANESEVIKQWPEHYLTSKEKLVGYTFRIAPDIKRFLSFQADRIQSEAAKKSILDNFNDLVIVFHSGGKENLRSVRAGLFQFERVVDILDSALSKSRELSL